MTPSIIVGRYALFGEIASGGMGTVHLARRVDGDGAAAVAVKRLHPHLRREDDLAMMLLDEARLAMSVHHRNVVRVLDLVSTHDELLLVMEYVPGLSLHELMRRDPRAPRVPLDVAVTIAVDVLHGLHAAHEAVGSDGRPLHLVHRDVSPHNVIVEASGVTKLTDFGVAKAAGRLRSTRGGGGIKGKVGYMSPEQVAGAPLDARSDVYATAVVLWEMLAGRPMFEADNDVALFGKAMRGPTQRVAELVPETPRMLDAAVWRALSRDPRRRHPTALAFAEALVEAVGAGDATKVAAWVAERGRTELEARDRAIEMIVHSTDEPTITGVEIARRHDSSAEEPTITDATITLTSVEASHEPPTTLEQHPVIHATAPMAAPRPAHAARTLAALLAATLCVGALGAVLLRAPTKPPALARAELGGETVEPETLEPGPPSPAPAVLFEPSEAASPVVAAPAAPPASAVVPGPSAPPAVARTGPSAGGAARVSPRRGATSGRRQDPSRAADAKAEAAKPETTRPGAKTDPPKGERNADCNPSYSVDEHGVKHFKAWCLR